MTADSCANDGITASPCVRDVIKADSHQADDNNSQYLCSGVIIADTDVRDASTADANARDVITADTCM